MQAKNLEERQMQTLFASAESDAGPFQASGTGGTLGNKQGGQPLTVPLCFFAIWSPRGAIWSPRSDLTVLPGAQAVH